MTNIRFARITDARILSQIAMESKSYWGYDDDFLEKCRYALTITPKMIVRQHMFVYEDHHIKGFYGIDAEQYELTYMFVDPVQIGEGLGKHLFSHAIHTARQLELPYLIIHSDPHADGFYQKMGARTIGEVPSEVDPDRYLPLLKIDIQ
ncbi:N-acetylglutamate synthase-like GNAT family acetyltransferase [Melghiribacillus thermohalophilus]|uniref:N-acetylglutamate synthase-like GNAT family acetyltransferase n=1 Tax=Melghiribacillus thermohalophilus TaxID=1324956 RepID=A0A4R3MM25_9BACI|nr:GNAT family N-acetyltransferase [Melghiribacillus thermohalophilus]TCT15983.1 N-acetylglutamate synthase-like GNAT family acetyltransferase [Melghiribacillus thermohalophilus]